MLIIIKQYLPKLKLLLKTETLPYFRYNCSPRVACTGRRRHCYGLCKVTVYSANKNVAIVQFAGGHGTGAIQRRAWPYNGHQYDFEPVSHCSLITPHLSHFFRCHCALPGTPVITFDFHTTVYCIVYLPKTKKLVVWVGET